MIVADFRLSKRYDIFGNFSRYIPEESTRIQVTQSSGIPLLISAYKKDDEYTLVTINSSKQTIQTSLRLDGANINGLLKQYITNEDNSWTEMAIVQENKEYYNLTIPPYSVVTFVGKVRL